MEPKAIGSPQAFLNSLTNRLHHPCRVRSSEVRLSHNLTIERTSEGLLLHSSKLSWEETARQMAESEEEWSPFEVTVGDGLDGGY
jgi:hypothetical protein